MEFDGIWGYLVTMLGSGGIVELFNIRYNRKKNNESLKKDEIENLNAIVESVYKPTIDHLMKRVEELNQEVETLRNERKEIQEQHQKEIEMIKEDCSKKSEILRRQIIELAGALNTKVDKPSRGRDGKFVKKH